MQGTDKIKTVFWNLNISYKMDFGFKFRKQKTYKKIYTCNRVN